jgi:hypothetical protein
MRKELFTFYLLLVKKMGAAYSAAAPAVRTSL